MRILAITSPRSKPRQIEPFARLAKQHKVECTILDSPAVSEVAYALSAQPDAALIFGGDGTLNRHLPALVESKVPFLPVPAGSGNDFSHSIGIPDSLEALAIFDVFLRGSASPTAIDLGTATFEDGSIRYFSCCLNIGVDADAARRANLLPAWLKSRKGYFVAGAVSILRYAPSVIRVQTEAAVLEEEAWLFSLSNTPEYGGGLKIAPCAKLDDGLFDATFLRASGLTRAALMFHLPKILSGAQASVRQLRQFQIGKAAVSAASRLQVFGDGEPLGVTPLTAECLPGAVKALSRVPNGTKAISRIDRAATQD